RAIDDLRVTVKPNPHRVRIRGELYSELRRDQSERVLLRVLHQENDDSRHDFAMSQADRTHTRNEPPHDQLVLMVVAWKRLELVGGGESSCLLHRLFRSH